MRPSLAAKFAPIALAPESSPLAREAANAAQSFWHWLPWSKWSKLRKAVEAWYPTGVLKETSIRVDIAELATYHRRIDAAWQIATAYAKELSVDANGKADWATTTTALKDIEHLGRWKAAADLKSMAGPGGSLDRKQLRLSSEKLTHTLKEFDDSWQAILKDMIVTDRTGILAKPASEIAAWLENEAAAIESEATTLERVVGLLKLGKDVAAPTLIERTNHLRKLVEARNRIATASETIKETRSSEEVEAIDHTSIATLASSLLTFLKEWACPLTPGVIGALTDSSARERLGGLVRNSDAAHAEFDKAWHRITTDLFDPDMLVSTNLILNKTPLGELKKWADARTDDFDRLAEWAKYLLVEKEATAFGLNGIIQEVKAGEFGPTDAANAFRARLYRLWLDGLHQKVPILGSFATSTHERLISRFTELDRLHIRSTPARVRGELLLNAERPKTRENAPETSELGILLREVHKKQRHLPLRRLFTQIPWVLPRLKPCLMMSPLAVSTFLDNPELMFDLVIFDEASQVRPHDAVCAIYRGRQLVVGGDPRQLPPTDFFNRSDDAEDPTSDESSIASYESLLDVCLSRGLMRKWLRWHYRSQRESLIAFSNRHFYESRLITFPSADEATGPAINFIKVPEGRFKDGINPIEAKQVAKLVMEHARSSPNLTLGVIAFSQRQQDRILDELEILRRQNPATETFFAEDNTEPFFVKNLENVQGDERDAIYLSIGYGPDETGKVAMRFGPLNQQGGERRLNVAITRARRAMAVVSSLAAADIDLTRAHAEGAKLMRAFLDYAARGPIALGEPSDNLKQETESPFEREVGDELTRRGLTVHRNIGCSDYRIDLAITDSQQSGKYILGVECDGATYHSAATARDRDRLRQAVLEGLGWRLIRVWSSDWIRDRDKQVKRILAALKEATNPKKPASGDLEFKKSPVEKKRFPKPTEFEDIEAVPSSALADAIVATLTTFGSMPAEELTAAVSKQLGFKRTGPKIRDRVIAGVNEMVAAGTLILADDNRVRLVPPGSTTRNKPAGISGL
ncbi:MAG TPA: AAA domain-containing protein [Gemmata sp.]|nr:AAA domain-containing protein [Gemmata sp.]